MIQFKNIKMKNFMSVGEQEISINFLKNKSTLITGTNGASKSAIFTDALTYALYNKPYRKVNLPQLINSHNGKNCVVEVEFKIGKNDFKIVRGMKPKVFQVFRNNEELNADGSNVDFQEYFETQILKMNHKAFTQIVILSSANFVPFMKLSTGDRRNLIENLLDIQVFSKMNQVYKTKFDALKQEKSSIEKDEEILKSQISSVIETVKQAQAMSANVKEVFETKIAEKTNELNQLQQQIDGEDASIGELFQTKFGQLNSYQFQINSFEKEIAVNNHEKQKFMKDAKFYVEHDSCPTCTQEISKDLKKKKVTSVKNDINLIEQTISDLQTKISTLNEEKISLQQEADLLKQRFDTLTSNKRKVVSIKNEISKLQEEMQTSSQIVDVKIYKEQLQDLKTKLDKVKEKKLEILEDFNVYNTAGMLLKDSGIKAKIVKQYIPVINKLVNGYLQDFGFPINFEFDEQFNEKIKSPYRDDFSYESFSEGEKARIDLSLLFTWRELTRMRNSVATNLLIMDEVFDGSLDMNAGDCLISILTKMKKSNIFVISHTGEHLYDKLHGHIRIEKQHGFARIK